MRIRAKLEGMNQLSSALTRYEKRLSQAVHTGLRAAAKDLRNYSRPMAPEDTGALKKSGVWWSEGEGFSTIAYVGYGDEVEGYYDDRGRERIPREYVMYQHDDPYNVRWLENAVDEHYSEAARIIYEHAERASS